MITYIIQNKLGLYFASPYYSKSFFGATLYETKEKAEKAIKYKSMPEEDKLLCKITKLNVEIINEQ